MSDKTALPKRTKSRTLTIKAPANVSQTESEAETPPESEQVAPDLPEALGQAGIDILRNRKLQVGFTCAVAIGFFFALLGLWDKAPVWVGLLGPLLAIVGFFAFGRLNGFGEHTDTRQQFADSCYFLGFLLTMIAMLVGFLPAGLLGDEITSQGILRHFSMALGATALGLIFRIFVMQGGRSLDQLSAEIETDLLRYAREVSFEAKAIAQELSTARAELSEHRQNLQSIMTTDFPDSIRTVITPLQSSANETSQHLRTQTDFIVEASRRLQEALNGAAQSVVVAGKIEGEGRDKVAEAGASINEALSQFSTAIDALRTELAELGKNTGHEIRGLSTALSQSAAAAPGLLGATNNLATTLANAETHLGRVSASSVNFASRLESELSENGRLLTDLAGAQSQATESLRLAGERAAISIAEATTATTQYLEGSRQDLKKSLEEKSTDLTASLSSTGATFTSDLSRVTGELVAVLHDFSRKIDDARKAAQ